MGRVAIAEKIGEVLDPDSKIPGRDTAGIVFGVFEKAEHLGRKVLSDGGCSTLR